VRGGLGLGVAGHLVDVEEVVQPHEREDAADEDPGQQERHARGAGQFETHRSLRAAVVGSSLDSTPRSRCDNITSPSSNPNLFILHLI